MTDQEFLEQLARHYAQQGIEIALRLQAIRADLDKLSALRVAVAKQSDPALVEAILGPEREDFVVIDPSAPPQSGAAMRAKKLRLGASATKRRATEEEYAEAAYRRECQERWPNATYDEIEDRVRIWAEDHGRAS